MAGRKDKNTVDYFPHYCVSGKTMFILESKYGNDGYAVWFKILELLGSSENHYIDCRKIEDVEYLIAKMRVDEAVFYAIVQTLVKSGAIHDELWDNRIIWSYNFINGIQDAYKRRSVECMHFFDLCKHLYIKCKHKYDNCGVIVDTNTHTILYDSKVDDTIQKETIENDVDMIYKAYPTKCPIKQTSTGKSKADKDKIKSILRKMQASDLLTIIELYVSDCTKNRVYMKNFKTFLNNIPDIDEAENITPTKSRMYSYMIPEIGEKIGTEAEYEADRIIYGNHCQFNMYK